MDIKEIFVCGAGLMGGGIAQVCAQAGYSVTMMDINEGIIEKAMKSIRWSVSKMAEKGKVESNVDQIIGRIRTTTKIDDARDADFAIEAVVEKLEVKRQVFSELDKICPAHTILATNTSSIPITEIAEATKRPDKGVGTHFFSPVPLMGIVEIVRGLLTSDETVEVTTKLCQSLSKETITVNRDVAGFVFNRINLPSTFEAVRLVEAGVVSVEDVDRGMRLGFGRPMGPFETGDMAGLDVGLNSSMTIYKETGDPKFLAPMLYQRKVKAGHLGRKTGIGWYKYDKNGKRTGSAD